MKIKPILFGFLLATACLTLANAQIPSTPNSFQSPSTLIETGKVRFYETKQIRGEENYEIRRTPAGELRPAH